MLIMLGYKLIDKFVDIILGYGGAIDLWTFEGDAAIRPFGVCRLRGDGRFAVLLLVVLAMIYSRKCIIFPEYLIY